MYRFAAAVEFRSSGDMIHEKVVYMWGNKFLEILRGPRRQVDQSKYEPEL
jgi:hypothetical protein